MKNLYNKEMENKENYASDNRTIFNINDLTRNRYKGKEIILPHNTKTILNNIYKSANKNKKKSNTNTIVNPYNKNEILTVKPIKNEFKQYKEKYGKFKTLIFSGLNDNINSMVIDNSTRLKITDDRYLSLCKSQKIITYRNTDIGLTDNLNRFLQTHETFGYPYRRIRNSYIEITAKDRIEKTKYGVIKILSVDENNNKQIKYLLDNIFINRLYRFYYLLSTYKLPNNKKSSYPKIVKLKKYITYDEVITILKEIYNLYITNNKVKTNYNKYLYHKNGLPKINIKWLQYIITDIENNAYRGKYKNSKTNRYTLISHKYKLLTIEDKPLKCSRLHITDKQIIPIDTDYEKTKQDLLNKINKSN